MGEINESIKNALGYLATIKYANLDKAGKAKLMKVYQEELSDYKSAAKDKKCPAYSKKVAAAYVESEIARMKKYVSEEGAKAKAAAAPTRAAARDAARSRKAAMAAARSRAAAMAAARSRKAAARDAAMAAARSRAAARAAAVRDAAAANQRAAAMAAAARFKARAAAM